MTSFQAPVRAERLLESLTDEQRAVVESTSPRIRVVAAPGSGKTRVLAARVVALIRFRGVSPRQIRAFVFTRSAAAVLRDRVAAVLGGEVAEAVDVTTFHGYAARVALRHHPDVAEVASEDLAEAALRSLYEGPLRRARRDVPGIEAVRDAIVRHEAGLAVSPEGLRAIRLVRSRVEASGAWPLWWLLPVASDLLQDRATAAEEAVDHLLVDESQDVTPREAALVRALAASSDLCCVGDPRQAIMGFRGGDPAAMDWVSETALALSRTFRFGGAIATWANEIPIGNWPPVEPDHGVESSAVLVNDASFVDLVRAGVLGRDAAVLCRTHDDCAAAAARLGDGFVHFGRDHAGDVFADARRLGRVPVATIHLAKGAEFDVVAVPPHPHWRDRDDAEERRVRFVAYTRARRRLIVGAP